jgi:DNA-binding transcriptional LysR family regulator
LPSRIAGANSARLDGLVVGGQRALEARRVDTEGGGQLGRRAGLDARRHGPFVVLTTGDSELARLPGVSSPEQLRGHRLIVPQTVLAAADVHAAGLRLDRAVAVPLAATIPPLVAGRVGTGLVPRSEVEHAAAGLVALPTAGLIAPRRVLLAWHAARRRPAPLEAFCDVATTAFAAGMSTPAAVLVPVA